MPTACHVPSQKEKYETYVSSELNGIERDLKVVLGESLVYRGWMHV